jgi:ribosomal protein S18 acetylase RimI-like enzyme
MQVRIRKATAEDYTALCALFDEVDTTHRNKLPHIFQKPPGPAREPDYYSELIADANVGLFVAEVSGKLVGFLSAAIRDSPPIPILVPRRYLSVADIGVTAAVRRHGIGRRLLDAAHAWASTQGATTSELNVYEFNAQAIAFYESLGYSTISRKMSRPLCEG